MWKKRIAGLLSVAVWAGMPLLACVNVPPVRAAENDWRAAYRETLDAYKASPVYHDAFEPRWDLADVDGDGIPELFATCGEAIADDVAIYSYRDQQVTGVTYESEDAIFVDRFGSMGVVSVCPEEHLIGAGYYNHGTAYEAEYRYQDAKLELISDWYTNEPDVGEEDAVYKYNGQEVGAEEFQTTYDTYLAKNWIAVGRQYSFDDYTPLDDTAEETTQAVLDTPNLLPWNDVTIHGAAWTGDGEMRHIRWEPVEGADGYEYALTEVIECEDGLDEFTQTNETDRTWFITGSSIPCRVSLRVRAYRIDENDVKVYSDWSEQRSAIVSYVPMDLFGDLEDSQNNAPEAWRDAFKEELRAFQTKLGDEPDGTVSMRYGLADLDGDGQPELIVSFTKQGEPDTGRAAFLYNGVMLTITEADTSLYEKAVAVDCPYDPSDMTPIDAWGTQVPTELPTEEITADAAETVPVAQTEPETQAPTVPPAQADSSVTSSVSASPKTGTKGIAGCLAGVAAAAGMLAVSRRRK